MIRSCRRFAALGIVSRVCAESIPLDKTGISGRVGVRTYWWSTGATHRALGGKIQQQTQRWSAGTTPSIVWMLFTVLTVLPVMGNAQDATTRDTGRDPGPEVFATSERPSASPSVLSATMLARVAALEQRAQEQLAQDPPDWTGALSELTEAAYAGSIWAMSLLGWMYEDGEGVAPDVLQSVYWYEQAAQAGALEFALKLAWMYLGGQEVGADREKAEAWFQFAIQRGLVSAQIALASVLIADAMGGVAVERVHEARQWLLSALASGEPLAAFFLTRLYREGIGGHPVDANLAADFARLGAEAGNAQLQGWLAQMHLEGEGVPVDPVEAAMWANLAASGGDAWGNTLRLHLEEILSPEQRQEARERAWRWALERF